MLGVFRMLGCWCYVKFVGQCFGCVYYVGMFVVYVGVFGVCSIFGVFYRGGWC